MTGSPFAALPGEVDFPDLDRRIPRFWARGNFFARNLERTAHGPSWVFYEGPATANGSPGTHHVEARVFRTSSPGSRPSTLDEVRDAMDMRY